MPRARTLGVLAVALALPYSGCSLMSLDEFDARPCVSDLDCAEAQRRAGLDATLCGHCTDRLCDFQHRQESCNGKDDDCDGLIDEDVTGTPRRLTGVSAPTDAVAFTTASDGTNETFVVIAGETRHGFVVRKDDSVEPEMEVLRYDSATGDPDFPCPYRDQYGELSAMKCGFTELAIAVDTEHLLYAGVNRLGCAQGQLRVGLADRQEDPFKVWLGDPTEASATSVSDLALGVDVDGTCSGKSLAADASVTPGARGPAIASVSTTPGAAGALVTWLGASAEVAPLGCSSAWSVPVEALGIYVPEGAERSLFGTGDGVPPVLGLSTSLEPPAVVALASPGGEPSFVVGFAAEEVGERGVRLVRVLPRHHELKAEPVAFIHGAAAERVVLALGERGSDGPEIGVLWTEPCAHPPVLHFTALSLSKSEPATPPLTIETSRLLQAPQLLHQTEGFSTAARHGGWFVLWAQASAKVGEVKLARLLDGSNTPLNVVTLSTGTVGFPLLLPSDATSINQALLQSGDDEREVIGMSRGWCGVRG